MPNITVDYLRDVFSIGMIPRSPDKIILDYFPTSVSSLRNTLALDASLNRPISSAFHFRSSASIAAQEINQSCGVNRSTFILPQSTQEPGNNQFYFIYFRQLKAILPTGHVAGYAELQSLPFQWYQLAWFPEGTFTVTKWPLDRLPDGPQIFVTDAYSLAQNGINTHPPSASQPISTAQALSILQGAGGANFIRKVRHTQTAALLRDRYGFFGAFDDTNFTSPDTTNYVILLYRNSQIIHFGQTLTEQELTAGADQWWLIGPR